VRWGQDDAAACAGAWKEEGWEHTEQWHPPPTTETAGGTWGGR